MAALMRFSLFSFVFCIIFNNRDLIAFFQMFSCANANSVTTKLRIANSFLANPLKPYSISKYPMKAEMRFKIVKELVRSKRSHVLQDLNHWQLIREGPLNCLNGAFYSLSDDRCICTQGFIGNRCETLDPRISIDLLSTRSPLELFLRRESQTCDQLNCQNGASCIHDFDNGGYFCDCPLGFLPPNCVEEVKNCENSKYNLCSKERICVTISRGYLCLRTDAMFQGQFLDNLKWKRRAELQNL